ncbi:ATP-binding protein [Elioraea thermophila]|uniref:ATP-binding protein n=1 Tax=Elioraea thermophila TaxID=2185104 RepID=UPI000DF2A5DD|nr:ATP-binding protein [Elioraea thermophila]
MAALPRRLDAASPEAALADMSLSAQRLNRWIALLLGGLMLAPLIAILVGAAWLKAIAMSEGRARLAEVLDLAAYHTRTVLSVSVDVGRRVNEIASLRPAAEVRSDEGLRRLLATIADRHAHIAAIAIVDAEGRVLVHSLPQAWGEDMRLPLPGPDEIGTLEGEPVAVVPPRPLPGGGEFAFGVVVPCETPGAVDATVVLIPTGYLQRAFAGISPFVDFTVAWISRDGWVLASRPPEVAPARLDTRLARLLRAWQGGAENGEIEEMTVEEGRRLIAWRAIGPKLVAVSVTGSRSGLSRAHDKVAIGFGLVLLLASVAIGALAYALWRAAHAHADLVECVIDADEARRKAEDQLHQAQKLEAVGLLTGGVAHDFNNLLAVLMGSAESLQNRFPEDQTVRETTDLMMATIERGARLTADLLSFARKQMLFPVACDVSAQIRKSRTLLAKAAGEQNQLVFDLAPRPLPVRVDPAHLDACLINLISNAHDVIERDGRIVVRTRMRLIRASERDATGLEPGRYAVIDVEDNGRGMPPEVAARAFEPFFTTKALGRGTGLGLAMVYGFAQQSGGTAIIESKPGRGTRVSVFLPLTAEAIPPEPPRPATVPTRIEAHVLLVDDDPTVRHVMAETLKALGARVTEAHDAASARARLSEANPDVLVTDVIMPGDMNGYELALWARRGGKVLPTLLISGFAGSQLPEDLARQEAIAFLAKPIARADLAAAIAALLQAGAAKGAGAGTGQGT